MASRIISSSTRGGATQVIVAADDSLKAIPVEQPGFTLVSGPWTGGDVQLAVVFASLGTGLGTVLYLKFGARRNDDEPRVLT